MQGPIVYPTLRAMWHRLQEFLLLPFLEFGKSFREAMRILTRRNEEGERSFYAKAKGCFGSFAEVAACSAFAICVNTRLHRSCRL
jgi:hypothetical protein